jgi:hypothetical protein
MTICFTAAQPDPLGTRHSGQGTACHGVGLRMPPGMLCRLLSHIEKTRI